MCVCVACQCSDDHLGVLALESEGRLASGGTQERVDSRLAAALPAVVTFRVVGGCPSQRGRGVASEAGGPEGELATPSGTLHVRHSLLQLVLVCVQFLQQQIAPSTLVVLLLPHTDRQTQG